MWVRWLRHGPNSRHLVTTYLGEPLDGMTPQRRAALGAFFKED